MRFSVVPALAPASACAAPAPMTPERAERLCAEQVGLADGFAGAVEVGIGDGGTRTGASITLSERIFNPQTDREFMADCVERRLEGKPAMTEVNVSARRAI